MKEELKRVLDENEKWIMSQPGVTGCGVGNGEIVVYTNRPPLTTFEEIRKRLEGYTVTFRETGEIRKQEKP